MAASLPCPFFIYMKLNLQSIRIAERLLNKPFGEFDLSSDKDSDILIYSAMVANSDEVFTYETYQRLPNKIKGKALKQIFTQLSFMNQFNDEDEGKTLKETKPVYIGEVAANLILAGMDAHYVLYDMYLFELRDYFKAVETKIKNKLENDRLWAYFIVLPHVDTRGGKMKSPRDLLTFAWELEEEKEKKEKEFKIAEAKFWEFMKSEPLKN